MSTLYPRPNWSRYRAQDSIRESVNLDEALRRSGKPYRPAEAAVLLAETVKVLQQMTAQRAKQN